MAPLQPIDVAARACGRIGVDPPESFDDELPIGGTVQLVYDSIVEFALGFYPWTFAEKISQLSIISAPSILLGYGKAFNLPADRLGPPRRFTDDPRCDRGYTALILQGDVVYADAAALYAVHGYKPLPHLWSSAFLEAVTLALAAEFALAFVSDRNLWASLREAAYGTDSMNFRGGVIGSAIQEDAGKRPPRRLPYGSDPLSRVHASLGGSSWSWR